MHAVSGIAQSVQSDVSDCVASLRCTELSSAVSVADVTGKQTWLLSAQSSVNMVTKGQNYEKL